MLNKLQKIPTKLLVTFVFILLSAIVFLVQINKKPTKIIKASWWSPSWSYRKAIPITYSGTALSDFQVSFDIGTSALVNAGKMKSDCADIRVTDASNNLLYHWIEENNPGCNSPLGDTKIWTKVSSIPDGGTTIYVYYGNSNATDTQSGDDVFEFFDDFESWSNWTTYSSGTVTQSNTRVFSGNHSAYKDTASDPNGAYKDISQQLGRNIIVEFWVNRNSSYSGGGADRVGVIDDNGNGYGWIYSHSSNLIGKDKRTSYSGVYTSSSANSGYVDMWVKGQLVISSDNTITAKRYHNNQVIGEHSSSDSAYSNFSRVYILGGYDYWIDNITIRKHTSSTPTTSPQVEQEKPNYSAEIGGVGTTGTPLSQKLIAHYKFDEGYGSTAHDTVGANHGTFGTGSSAPTWTQNGKVGKALKYDGINDYISIPYSKNTTIRTETISTWVYRTGVGSTNSAGIVNIMQMIQNPQTSINTNSLTQDMVSCSGSYNPSSISSGSTDLPINQWTHILCVFDYNGQDMNISLYKNGQFIIANSGAASTYQYSADYINIGVQKAMLKRFFNGIIDEVKIYNYALTADEIKQDYNQGVSAVIGKSDSDTGSTAPSGSSSQEYCVPGDTSPCSPPVAEWTFDKRDATYAFDTSGNSNHGTLGTGNSAPTYTPGKIGNALSFDGGDITINNTVSYGDNFTFESWIYPTDTSLVETYGRTIVSSSPSGGLYYPIWILVANQQIKVYAYQSNSGTYHLSTFNNIQANTWYHIAVSATKNSSGGKLYINGQLDSTFSAGNQSANNYICLGDLRPGRNLSYKGIIDQIKLYNYARTPAQIAWDYNRGAPIAHYKLDEIEGTIAHDTSENQLHGTLGSGSSAPTWVTGKTGNALSFDGQNDYVNLGNNNQLDLTEEFTLSAWIYRTSDNSTFERIISKSNKNDTGNRDWSYYMQIGTSDTVQIGCGTTTDNPYFLSNTIIETGQWYHIVGTKNSTEFKIYINGILDNSGVTNAMGDCQDNDWNTYIGMLGSGGINYFNFNGLIDDVQIFNYPLTADQIKILYNQGAVSFQ